MAKAAYIADLNDGGFRNLLLYIEVEILNVRSAVILTDGEDAEGRCGCGCAENRDAGLGRLSQVEAER